MYDDRFTIVENNYIYIKDFKNLKYIFTREYSTFIEGEITYRPVCTFSYFFDYYLYGMNPVGFHLTNIIWHSLSCILVYFFIFLISGNFPLSFITSLFYAIHPIQTESVNAISFRWDIMAMTFLLTSIIAFIKMMRATSHKYFYYALSLFSFVLAIFSKESALIAPLIIVIYSFIYRDIKEIIKQKYYYLGFFLILLFYVYIVQFIAQNPVRKINYYEGSMLTTFLTMSKVFVYYLYNLIFPLNLYADYIIPFSYSVLEVKVILSILTIVILLMAGIILRKINKETSFGVFYFFITLIPVSNIIPFGHLMNDRYLYIPSLGFCLVLSYLLLKLFKNKYHLLAVVFLIFLFYSTRTISQNIIWQDEMRLWKNVYQKFPNSSRANYNISATYLEKGNNQEALKYLKKVEHLNPGDARVYNNIGIIYASWNLSEDALKYYDMALRINPKYVKALNNRGIVYYNLNEYDTAIEDYNKVIKLDPEYANAYNNRGIAYAKKGEYNKAIKDYTSAIQLNPEFAIAYKNRGITYLHQGKKQLAIDDFVKAEGLGYKLGFPK